MAEDHNSPDDFDMEIAKTRANDELMAFLEQRAQEPATVTLEQIRERLRMSESPQ